MVPEMPMPHVMRYGAIAYAPTGEWGRSRVTRSSHKQSEPLWSSAA